MLLLQAFSKAPEPALDLITYDIWRQALWAIPTVLGEIDLDGMRAEAIKRGSAPDLRLVASLIQLKREDHQPP